MNCMKCGRETDDNNVFCQNCLLEMEKYPVQPGSVVLLPRRKESSVVRKAPKRHFYSADEPVGAVWNKITGSKNMTADDVKTFYGHLENYWEAPRTIVPYHENHPYPYFHYTTSLTKYEDYQLTDSTQAMIDQGGISIWCPQIYAFTPRSELTAAGYKVWVPSLSVI